MKKILVVVFLLGVSALSANNTFYPDGHIEDFLKIEKGIYPKKACDEPQSQACQVEKKEICKEDEECLNSYARLNNTSRDRYEADRSVEYFLNNSLQEQYNQNNFKQFLGTAKSLGWSKEEVLNIKIQYEDEDRSLLQVIQNKKLEKQLQDIEQIFNSK